MHDIVVYSCVAGRYDDVRRSLLSRVGLVDDSIAYVLYTDEVDSPTYVEVEGGRWKLHPLLYRHPLCHRRTSRWHKVNSHALNVRAAVTVWIDGTQRIRPNIDIRKMVDETIRGFDIATFRHPDRTCIYEELAACRRWNKDNPILMESQIKRYRAEGYPAYAGLVETTCVIRRDTERVKQFNRKWWEQIDSGSVRDQLSFNYVARKTGTAYGVVPGSRSESQFFEYVDHAR